MSHKHGKKKTRNYGPVAAVTIGAGAISGIALASPASAATASEWDAVAQCESGGNWSISTGNGYYGGLQFSASTWSEYGGGAFASSANLASKAQQIAIGEKVLAGQGRGAWPVCGTGLSSTPYGGSTGPVTPPASTGGSTSPAVGSKAYLAIQYAKAHISSAQYLWGGNGPTRFDCSGLTAQAWEAAGVHLLSIARDSYAQEAGGWAGSSKQTLATIRPGDLVAYNGFSGGHVALYVGPIGPNGENLIETNSRHPGSGVNWSFMDSRSGRDTSMITGITRPAPFVGASTTTPPPVTPPTTPPPSSSGGTYIVQSGDTLSKIAAAKNVTGGWPALYEANRAVIGSNPNLIYPGQKLTIPGGVVTPPAATAVKPVDGPIIQEFGNIDSSYQLGYHTGVDFQAPTGTPVKAAVAGTVVAGNAGSAYGNHVIIKHADGKYTLSAHLSAKTALAAPGTVVKAGDVIGFVGSTGNSTGPHLHFEVRKYPTEFHDSMFYDPIVWLKGYGVTY